MFNSKFPNANNVLSNNPFDLNLQGQSPQGYLANSHLNYLYLLQYQQAIIQNLQNMELARNKGTNTINTFNAMNPMNNLNNIITTEKVNFLLTLRKISIHAQVIKRWT
jgi:hypothetical protein